MLSLVLWMVGAASAESPQISDYLRSWNPQAQLMFRGRERSEEGFDERGLWVLLRAGVFPEFERLLLGIEVGTQINRSYEVPLGGTTDAKPLGIHQVYLGLQRLHGFVSITAMVGKFKNPILASPLMMDPDLRPQGFFESVSVKTANSRLLIGVYGGQYLLDQQSESRVTGQPQKWTWLLQQGLQGAYVWSQELQLRAAINSYFFTELTADLHEDAARSGNLFSGTLGSDARATRSWAPIEFLWEAIAQPIGVEASAEAAFILNPRTEDLQRGFWFRAGLGRPWQERSGRAEIGYFYSEPDVSLSLLKDPFLGDGNRKGPFARVHFYPTSKTRLGASYVYAATVAPSSVQSDRHEIAGEIEWTF